MKPSLYFVLTENCNLKCQHCYLSAGPGKKNTTVSSENFKKAVEHFPKIALELALSGGEIFTIKNELYGFLNYLNFENRKREKNNQGKINVILQTNGTWATSDEKTRHILEELKNFEIVNILEITSRDKYHFEQGFDRKCLDRIFEQTKEMEYFDSVEIRGIPNEKKYILPIGRGAKLHQRIKKIGPIKERCCKSLDNYWLNINPLGKVTICVMGKIPLGNIFEEPLDKIVEMAKKNSTLKALNDGGALKLAVQHGWDKEEAKELIKRKGECGFCWGAVDFVYE